MLPESILEISRDPLFKAVYPDRTSWVQTGRPLEPYGRHAGHSDVDRVGLAGALAGLVRRRYDFVVFPALRPWGPGDAQQPMRARLRRLLVRLTQYKATARLTEAAFGLNGLTYMIRDVSDIPDIDDPGLSILPKAAIYSKREVLEIDLTPAPGRPPVVYTPMPFELELYDGYSGVEKSVDVFYAARPNSELRAQAMEVVNRLGRQGLMVDIPDGRVDFEDYLTRLARARLVVSPRGNGEHCWRHYEALLVGAVPVINEPLRPVHYELRHNDTAIFYEPSPEMLHARIADALEDHGRLEEIARRGRELVRSTHGKPEVCRLLLDHAGFGESTASDT
jgi:hypothetical protein